MDGVAGEFYLLVFEGDSARMVELPPEGEVTVGNGRGADIHVEGPGVSEAHARLTLSGGEAVLSDLGSDSGTCVNDERVQGSRKLSSADVITLDDITLVFHRSPRMRPDRRILDLGRLQGRVEEELDRSLRYRRPLTVVVISLGLPSEERSGVAALITPKLRRSDIAAFHGNDQLVVLMPETNPEAAGVAAERLLRVLTPVTPAARAGIAVPPFDGCDADTLLASARAACAAAELGRTAMAAKSCRTIAVGRRSVIIADPAMSQLYRVIERMATADLPVLICGETGTGKELVASALHAWSSRRDRPMVALNCAALQDSLLESELFGHEKGAFTGSVSTKPGLFETADGGTVLLDEIDELSLMAQAKLLRVLETKRVTRLGDVRERDVNIRLVAATNRNLESHVRDGRFRQDLFYRLKGALLWIPPLRDRARELPHLARAFLEDACARAGRSPMALSSDAMRVLAAYGWPGNVRELRNMMDFLAAAAPEPVVEDWHIVEWLGQPSSRSAQRASDAPASCVPASDVRRRFRAIDEEVRELERARMVEALAAVGGNQKRAAELISMPLRTFVAKLKIHDIPRRKESPGRG
jgi:DNA-binding NtrC family response regulator/pSer/pThr/pTyr-binding forkhead associated (FHA) protein